ncbi:MAG TPA: HDIG domain-containing protein [Syntrophorhabdaceae bacterium]|nr:HDIG domain-containing protein [Syntrophorhabdaceae bacterium]
MQTGKEKPPSRFNVRKLAIFLLFALALSVVTNIGDYHLIREYRIGDIAGKDIKSPSDVTLPQSGTELKRGEIVVRDGARITEEDLEKLAAIRELNRETGFTLTNVLSLWMVLFLIITILIEFAERNIKKFLLSRKDLLFCTVFTIFSVLLVKSCALVFQYYAPGNVRQLFYIIPVFLFGITMRIVLFSEAAFIFSAIFSLAVAFGFENSLPVFLYALVGNTLAAHFSGRCENRNIILRAGVFTALIMAFITVLLDGFLHRQLMDIPIRFTFLLISGVASSFIALGVLPVVEAVFDYTTDIKLLELANLENPLLEQMMLNAPGTYHHSIVVGNLSKAAAESIGAHPLLTRVAAYYHDIGKLKMPHYFIENVADRDDAHKGLTPSMSALIILSHVKEGAELAAEHKLGTKITDIIRQHHGTSLVSYFYNKAKEQEDPGLHVIEEKDFRYAGPKPQTKEAGIIMLADAVEAASRTLEDPTPKRIVTHVQTVIENIFLDGQLDDCELTLKDLHAIQKSFITIFTGIFHQRIEYPERTSNGGTDKKLPKGPEDKRKEYQKRYGSIANLFGVSRQRP